MSSSESESDGEEEKESKEEMVGSNDGVDTTHQTNLALDVYQVYEGKDYFEISMGKPF